MIVGVRRVGTLRAEALREHEAVEHVERSAEAAGGLWRCGLVVLPKEEQVELVVVDVPHLVAVDPTREDGESKHAHDQHPIDAQEDDDAPAVDEARPHPPSALIIALGARPKAVEREEEGGEDEDRDPGGGAWLDDLEDVQPQRLVAKGGR